MHHDIPITGIIGHRQVTDASLAHLARSYSSRVATFDQALAELHADVADLIPAVDEAEILPDRRRPAGSAQRRLCRAAQWRPARLLRVTAVL